MMSAEVVGSATFGLGEFGTGRLGLLPFLAFPPVLGGWLVTGWSPRLASPDPFFFFVIV
jgi:hypothetical protein